MRLCLPRREYQHGKGEPNEQARDLQGRQTVRGSGDDDEDHGPQRSRGVDGSGQALEPDADDGPDAGALAPC
jgi:hypothetical protein